MLNNRDNFTLANIMVKPGERYDGEVELSGGRFKLPVTILHGEEAGQTVMIMAGIHSGEYVGIQAAMELSAKLKIEKVQGTIIIVKVAMRESFEARNGSLGMEDKCNLNREFPGDPNGSPTRQLAWAISQELLPVADYFIDLHSGDDYEQLTPYVYYAGAAQAEVVDKARDMAKQVDVPYMVRSNVQSGGAYNYAGSMGIPSILIERGGMGAWTMEEVRSTRKDVRNILCHIGVYKGTKDYRTYYPLDVTDVIYQAAEENGLWYPTKKPGEVFRRGDLLGRVTDYSGETLEVSRAEYDGVVLYQTGSLQVTKAGPMIAYGRIVPESDDRKERITSYWSRRSESFLKQRREELHSPLAGRWLEEIRKYLPGNRKLKILDVGCGTGFFTILLAKQGYQVTGTDLTPEMIENGKLLAAEEQADCTFMVMDAEKLTFDDGTFDVVISRNLTWTLPHADKAYEEWKRVLKSDGILLNIDANYGASDFADTRDLPENHAHHTLGDEMMLECEELKRQLPISTYARPAWDLNQLMKLSFEEYQIDTGISSRIYQEVDAFYNPTPLFLLSAGKKAK